MTLSILLPEDPRPTDRDFGYGYSPGAVRYAPNCASIRAGRTVYADTYIVGPSRYTWRSLADGGDPSLDDDSEDTQVIALPDVETGALVLGGSSILQRLPDGTSVAVAEVLRSGVLTVDSIGDLRVALTAGVEADVYHVRWHTARGDGGGGKFIGSNVGERVDDGGVTIVGGALAATREIHPSEPVSPRWYGAQCAGANESAAIQSCIAHCYATSLRKVILPTGIVVGTGINVTLSAAPTGLEFIGESRQSVIWLAAAGVPAFDLTGNWNVRFSRLHFQCTGVHTASAPSCFILAARKADNGSSGWHVFRECTFTGEATLGLVISLSSEVNEYHACSFDNRRENTTTIAIHDQNYLGVASQYATLPGTFTGGNTVHRFIGGVITAPGGTGVGLDISGARDVAMHGVHHNGSGAVGIQFSHAGSTVIELSGGSTEWTTSHGVLVKSGVTIADISISGFNGAADFYCEDTSVVQHLTLTSSQFVTGLSFATLEDSEVQTSLNSNGCIVRSASRNNTIISPHIAGTDYTQPGTNDGVDSRKSLVGADAIRRYYRSICDSPVSRLLAHGLVNKLDMAPVYTATFAAPGYWTPSLANGTYQYLLMVGAVEIPSIDTGNWNPGVPTESNSVVLTLILKQDATGGRVLTFGGSILANWTPNLAAGKVNVLSLRYVAAISKWVQMSASVGL